MLWTRCLLGCLVLLVGVSLAQLPPEKQPPNPPDTDPNGNGLWSPLVLPTEPALGKRLEAARDYLRVKDYPLALKQVQFVLDTPEDVLVKPPAEMGKPAPTSWQSLRRQAEGILDEISPQGRDTYRNVYEPQARAMLDKARQATDPQLLAEIVRRYRYTPSGETALTLLAGYHLDRGQAHPAAHRYGELLRLIPADRQPVGTLVRAVAAFRAVGNTPAADRAWQALTARAGSGKVKLGTRDFTLAELDKGLGKISAPVARADARLFRGDEQRNGSYAAKPPLLEPFVQVDAWGEKLGRDLLQRARKASPKALPGRHMIATGNKVLFRGAQGIVALDGVTGQQQWTAPLELGLDGLLRDPARKQQFLRWTGYYKDTLQGLLYENTLTGTLSTDGQRVYAIDDTALPVPPFMLFEMENGRKHLFSTLGPWLVCNRLRAFDLATGKPAWQLGGPKLQATVPEFADALFLGPPLPLDGLLWVLVEKQQKMTLYALDPATGAKRWSQTLGLSSDRIQKNLLRRCSAVQLAAADGLLIVPTHHGAVLAIDPLSRQLVWAHTWADKPAFLGENFNPEMTEQRDQWNTSYRYGAPLLAAGRIVLTGPDTRAIRCLHLETGAVAWTAELPGDEALYVAAVHKGTVLVVGKQQCHAYSLKSGDPLWQQPTGLPSGLGVLAGGTYWLPIAEGGLKAIDLANTVPPVSLGAAGSPVLGNLLVHGGAIWSQDALQVTAYPDVSKRLLALDDALVLAPENLTARLDRASMRLGQGETAGALQDVRFALARPDLGPERTLRGKELLFNALTQLLLREPKKAAPFLGEYLELCDVPISARLTPEARAKVERDRVRRRVQAGGLVARSYAADGKYRAAGDLLLRLIRSSGPELVPTPEEPAVEARADVQAERTFRALLAGAPPAGQAELRAALAGAVTAPTAGDGSDGLLRVARLADLLAPGECRRLLDRLLTLPVAPTRLLVLLDALEGRVSAPASVAPVRAEALLRAGLVADAAECYRRLGGAALDAARVDKRFLAAFEGPPGWTASRWTVKEERGLNQEPPHPLVRMTDDLGIGYVHLGMPADLPLTVARPESPLGQALRLAYDPKDRKIYVQNRAGATLWSVPTTSAPLDRFLQGLTPTGGYVILGTVAVVHVNTTLYGLDLLERRVRWSQRLLEVERGQQPPGFNMTLGGRLEAFDNNGQFQCRVGLGGQASPERVLVQLRNGLAALDPLTGAFLWRRDDVPAVVITGDDTAALLLETIPNDATIKQIRGLRPSDGRTLRPVAGLRERLANTTWFRWLGRDVLLWEQAGKLVRLDGLTGQERWSLAVPNATQLIESTVPNVLGWQREAGQVRLLDLTTGKEFGPVLAVGAGQLAENERSCLLADGARWYLAARSPQAAGGLSEPNPHVPLATPVVTVHGGLHAFDRTTGRLLWRSRMPGQVLLREALAGTPFVVTASQASRDAGNGLQRLVTLVRVVDKKSGKLLLDREEEMPDNAPNPQRVPYWMPFSGLTFDPQAHTLDLLGPAVRVRVAGQ